MHCLVTITLVRCSRPCASQLDSKTSLRYDTIAEFNVHIVDKQKTKSITLNEIIILGRRKHNITYVNGVGKAKRLQAHIFTKK